MPEKKVLANRRRFLQAALGAGAALATPYVIPGAVLGKDGAVPPSEQITMAGLGIGGRGSYVMSCFMKEPDARFVACCDPRADRRERTKRSIEAQYGSCREYRDFRELLACPDIDAVLITTGSNWHALLSMYAAKAGKDVYCEKPCTKTIMDSLALADVFRRTARVFQGGMQRRNVPHFVFAAELARSGKLGKLTAVHAHPAGLATVSSVWAPAQPEPDKNVVDWDMYLGPAAWRPFNSSLLNSGFEKGGGMLGGGCLEWGSHCIDMCQWANHADDTSPVEYFPVENGQATARYANGTKLVVRNDGWLPLGSCPVRYEGEAGWVEAGDSGKFILSSPALRGGKTVQEIAGYPATFHVRDFLNCVKSRGMPRANYEVACNTHITCHAVNIAIFLNRPLKYDPQKHEFIGDVEANRLRGEAIRDPWHV